MPNTIPNIDVAKDLLHHLYLIEHNSTFDKITNDFLSKLYAANFCPDMFVEKRIKAPISALDKFAKTQNGKYQTKWNIMKDLMGLMVVVNTNNEVEQILSFIEKNYKDKKNPYASSLIQDYRKKSNRDDEASKKRFVFQDPKDRNYQTTDGYKSAKANLMINSIPIEIQIKTKAQYIAHACTHDTIYKLSTIKEEKRFEIADKLFPYFEIFAYMRLYKDSLTPLEIRRAEEDVKEVYSRNLDIYSEYVNVFNEARAWYAVHFYMLLHREEFLKDANEKRLNLDMKIASMEVKQLYEYIFDKLSKENPSLIKTQIISRAINTLLDMPYNRYKKVVSKISGEYRYGACIITGIFDNLQPHHMDLFKRLSGAYEDVHVGVISDELSESYYGYPTVFNEVQRVTQVANCKGVTSARIVNSSDVKINYNIGPPQFDEPERKLYQMSCVLGGFDGFHPGHTEHLQMIIEQSEEVWVGVKTDDYIRRIKHKEPINNEQDRLRVIEGVRGIKKVFLTDNDMLPPSDFLAKAVKCMKKGGKVAIFLGSDWYNKYDEKPRKSLNEMRFVKSNYPDIIMTTTPRRNEKTMSSSVLRNKLIRAKERDTFPLELREIGESL